MFCGWLEKIWQTLTQNISSNLMIFSSPGRWWFLQFASPFPWPPSRPTEILPPYTNTPTRDNSHTSDKMLAKIRNDFAAMRERVANIMVVESSQPAVLKRIRQSLQGSVCSPEVHPGKCWAFRCSKGFLEISLTYPIRITPVTLEHIPKMLTLEHIPKMLTLEHIPKMLSRTWEIDSAPKDFVVYVIS
ncbi:hypothetical protein E1301_Tti015206 [Triplophysa tibetana]|uniref:SUN domain-containing protein n=1 Tax=Triplophysa tibetana TaxID=1572043 RepID=A0A5A9NRQ9_9TELE|nr:hypothetical protein E1301_Tti015206 [Triplophysa tibetana]